MFLQGRVNIGQQFWGIEEQCMPSSWQFLQYSEIFVSVHYRGMMNQSLEKVSHLFDSAIAHPIFGATMSRNRFKFLISHLSFDDKND